MAYLIINDIPTPWREPVFERVYNQLGGAVEIVYFKDNEKRRLWTFPHGAHPKTVLRAITITIGGTERFLNPGLLPFLLRRRPRIVLVFTSFKDPSGLLALFSCRLMGTKIALLDDTWLGRDQGICAARRLVRRIVYRGCGDAFVGASRQTLKMFQYYNPHVVQEQMFLSHLVADNDYFKKRLNGTHAQRRFDVIFSGRIVDVKNPLFFAEVCARLKARLGKCRVLIIGEGEERLKAGMRRIFDQGGVEYEFAGFIRHDQLPDYYAQARLLFLPTSADCWGVVINEAMLAGTPVITTEMTAAAGELVLHQQNGYVLPLNEEQWASAAAGLLSDQDKWNTFSRNAHSKVQEFNYDSAAAGILAAFAFLEGKRAGRARQKSLSKNLRACFENGIMRLWLGA